VSSKQHHYYVYIVASRTHVLYCGVTSNLEARVAQHKAGTIAGFTQRFHCNRLVWFERYQYVRNAIAREKQIKNWTRSKKLALIEEINPTWADLSEDWGSKPQIPPLRFAPGRDDKQDMVAWRKERLLTSHIRKSRPFRTSSIYHVFLMTVSKAKPPFWSRVALTARRGETWY
jgi:putative endonuclease